MEDRIRRMKHIDSRRLRRIQTQYASCLYEKNLSPIERETVFACYEAAKTLLYFRRLLGE